MKNKIITAGVLALSLIFVVTGIIKGQNTAVFEKAIKICLECVGIG